MERLLANSIGVFFVFRFVRRGRMFHPNEAQLGAGILHFDGHHGRLRKRLGSHKSMQCGYYDDLTDPLQPAFTFI